MIVEKRSGPVTDDEIGEWTKFYQERPYVEEGLREYRDAMTLPVEELQKRWRIRVALRKLVHLARTREQLSKVIQQLALAVKNNAITKEQAIKAIKKMEPRCQQSKSSKAS